MGSTTRHALVFLMISLTAALSYAEITLLEESFENGFGDWQSINGENDTGGTTGWQIVQTGSAHNGSYVAEIQSYEPSFGECVNKDKLLRSPSLPITGYNSISFSYQFDFSQTSPDTGGEYKAASQQISIFYMTPQQALDLERGLITVDELYQVTPEAAGSSKVAWQVFRGQINEDEVGGFGSHFVLGIRYRNSTSNACEQLRIDSVQIRGDVVTEVLDTRIAEPRDIGGMRFFQLGQAVRFAATTAPDQPEAFDYLWTFYDTQSTVPLFNLNGRQVSHTFENPGTYRVEVAAYNSQGEADPTPARLDLRIVESLDLRPTILKPIAAITRIHPGESVDFQAGIENPTKRQATSLEWRISPLGAERGEVVYQGQSATHTFTDSGKYLVELLIKTERGFVGMDLARRLVEVNDSFVTITSPRPARGERGQYVAEQNEPIVCTADISTNEPDTYLVWWRYPEQVEVCSDTTTCEISFPEAGTRAIVAMLMRGNEVLSKDMVFVTVSPGVYTQITSPQPNSYFAVGQEMRFHTDVTGSKADGAVVEWMVGTATASGQEVIKPTGISKPGTYQAKVVAIAADGTRSQDAVRFTVYDPEAVGQGAIIAPRTDLTVKPNAPVFFDALLNFTPSEQQRPMWRISDKTNGQLIKEKYNQVAGTLRFGQPGTYLAEFFLRSDEGEMLIDSRTVEVIAANPDAYDSNDSLENVAEMPFGRYHGMTLDRGHYFSTTIPEDGLTFRVSTQQLESAANIVLFDENGGNLVARKIRGAEPFQLSNVPAGTYRWGIFPPDEATAKRNLSFSIAIEVLNPALYFSDIQANENFDTEIGIINPTNGDTQAQLSAFDSSGQLLEKVDVVLTAGASLKESVNNLFPNFASSTAWIGVDATRELVGFANVVSLNQERAYAVSGIDHLSDQLFVPHIAQSTDVWFTEARVINGSANAAEPGLESGNFQDSLDNANSFSKSSFDFVNKFGGNINTGERWARFYDANGGAALGGNEVFGTHDQTRVVGLGLANLPSKNPSFTAVIDRIYFTHIADPANFWTALALVNTSETPTDVEIIAYDSDGNSLGSRFQNIAGFGTYTDVADSFLGDIPNANQTGWIEVRHSGTVMGYELFGTSSNKQMAGLEAITDLKNEICFPYLDASGNSYHGFSVVNVADDNVEVVFELYDAAGNVKDSETRQVNAKGKQIFLFEDLFGAISIDAGWIKATSPSSLAGFQLFGNPETMSGLIAK